MWPHVLPTVLLRSHSSAVQFTVFSVQSSAKPGSASQVEWGGLGERIFSTVQWVSG